MPIDLRLFHDFNAKIAIFLKLSVTARKILEEFVDIDVNTEAVAKIVERNQYFKHMLLQEIKAIGLEDVRPTLKATIALLGMQKVRDFVCALQIERVVAKRHPQCDAQGKLSFKPAEHLTYALKTEELAMARKLPYADTAYAAGMMFDVMRSVGRDVFGLEKDYADYVEEVYRHGLKAALVGIELSKSLKGFSYSKFVFSACLIHDVGKLAMALLYGAAFAKFRESIAAAQLSRAVIHFMEMKIFGMTHEYFGSQMAYHYQIFRPIEKAILFHHEPYLIRSSSKDLYALSCIMALASNVSNHFRIPKDSNDPLYRAWFSPELKDFNVVDPKAMVGVMAKLGRDNF